jgi:hypothetical protein
MKYSILIYTILFYIISVDIEAYENKVVNVSMDKKDFSKMKFYLYEENFEIKNPVIYWTKSYGLPKSTITYQLDNNFFSEEGHSLFIDANITAPLNNNKKWYYYMKVPLDHKPNLDGNLSFSIDINIDKESAKHLQIGLNIEYYPISNGTYIFKKIQNFNQWTTIKSSNLKDSTLEYSKKWIKKNIYNSKVENIGKRLNFIGILLKGRGDRHIKFHIDNIKIEGVEKKDREFRKERGEMWKKYLLNSKENLKKIQKIREKLHIIDNINLSPLELEKYRLGEKYIKKIDFILNKRKNSLYFNRKDMIDLNRTINFYKNNFNSLNSKENITVYKFPALEYYRLDGYNTPPLKVATSYKLRMTTGEYKSIALLMKANHHFETYTATSSDFIGENSFFEKENLDLYIAKIWYQAGLHNTHRTGKFLTQELLLKDDTLVKVDFLNKTNYLRVKDNGSRKERYIDISTPNKKFPKTDSITFNDSKELQPFHLDSIRHKLLWGIVHIPKNTPSGTYQSRIQIKNIQGEIKKEILIEVEVLPFLLDQSKLTYSLYYHGTLDKSAKPIYTYKKTAKQLEVELRDMKNHGVLYPTSYDNQVEKLDKILEIRDKIGFPKDRFYSLGIFTYSSNIAKKIKHYIKILNRHGYNNNALYIYSHDEADEKRLEIEKEKIRVAKSLGAKVFVAGYNYTYKHIGKILDLLIYAGGAVDGEARKQVQNWHQSKKEIFAYASPQVGVENPEIYRRNFGCKLWKENFDGAMDYAYQKQYGDFWNDFDKSSGGSLYREETFTYPTSNGIVGTVQWEGYREAITDVRYISTLENIRDRLKSKGIDTHELDIWIENIDCNSNLNILRNEIINKIIYHINGK